MAIKRKLSDEFRKNFSDSMYGSEVEFVDGFISDFADLLEEGKISHSKISFCSLEDVSKKFPEVYNKVRDSVLVDRSENYGKSVKNEYKRVALRERIISSLQDTFREGVKALKARSGIRMW